MGQPYGIYTREQNGGSVIRSFIPVYVMDVIYAPVIFRPVLPADGIDITPSAVIFGKFFRPDNDFRLSNLRVDKMITAPLSNVFLWAVITGFGYQPSNSQDLITGKPSHISRNIYLFLLTRADKKVYCK